MGCSRVQVLPFAVSLEIIFIGDFGLYLFLHSILIPYFLPFFKFFFSPFFFLKKRKRKKAQDALCSSLLLMGVVLMTARVHAEEKK